MLHKHTVPIRIVDECRHFLFILVILAVMYFFLDYEFVHKVLTIIFLYYVYDFIYYISTAWLKYKNFRYILSDDNLFVHSGALVQTEKITPLKRIQHVEIDQSLGSRLFQKYRVSIYTSGGSSHIGFITLEEAENLREKLIAFIEGNKLDIDIEQDENIGITSNNKKVADKCHE